MSNAKTNKETILRAMAAHVLDHGLTQVSLRPLAKAADTSDRMLVYHFGSKEKLIKELLDLLAAEFIEKLDAALPNSTAATHRDLLDSVLALVRSPVVAAYIRLWREITALASLGHELHRSTGNTIMSQITDWLSIRMPFGDSDPRHAAQMMATLVEGIHVMDAIGHSEMANAAIETLFPRIQPRRRLSLVQ